MRVGVERVDRPFLHDPPEVHHRHPAAEGADQVQVVRDEQVGDAEPVLELTEQLDHLHLSRHVQ